MSILKWMGPAMIALGAMVAPACDNEDTMGPDDVTPLLIVGGDMGAQSQSLSIARQGEAVTDAVVTVNGVMIPHTGGGLYRGQLAAVAPAGSRFDLQVSAGGASVQGSGNLPEAPILTAPRTGTVFAPTDSISFTWTSATNPDRFAVVASWVAGVDSSSKSFHASGALRELKIAASDIPAETEVTFKVLAYNDGSFTGPALQASRMNIRGEGPSDAVITRGVAPLGIFANMGARAQTVAISQAGQNVNDAAVTVNGVTISHSSGGFYEGELPEAVPPGSPLVLKVTSDGVTVEATGNVPEAPVLTAPATGTVFALTDSITVTWTSATDPNDFEVVFGSVFPGIILTPGTARELKVAAGDFGVVGTDLLSVSAINPGSFTGLADPDSRMNIFGLGSPSPVITIRP